MLAPPRLPTQTYWIATATVAIVAPWIASDQIVLLLLIAAIYSITAVGLDMLVGYAGQISFGQGGFVALGAYGSGLLSLELELPPTLTILATAVLVSIFAWLLGLVIFRLRGHYLAMATFSFGQVIFLLAGTLSLTGGSIGLVGIPPLSLLGFEIVSPSSAYYVAATVLSIALAFALLLRNSRVGRALIALRHDETAAAASGIRVLQYKSKVFAISAFMAAISGGLFAHYFSVASADSFGVQLSILLMAIVVVGGLGSSWGVPLGALLLVVLPGLVLTSTRFSGLVYGTLYVGVFLLFPGGIAGGIKQLSGRAGKQHGDGDSGEAPAFIVPGAR